MPKAPQPHRPAGYVERQHNQRRQSSCSRGYNRQWRDQTAAWVKEQIASGNGRCAECGKLFMGGREAIHVDHIVPTNGIDDPNHWLRTNWQMTHPGCHSKKTARDKAAGLTR